MICSPIILPVNMLVLLLFWVGQVRPTLRQIKTFWSFLNFRKRNMRCKSIT